jgi:hypothetical protein
MPRKSAWNGKKNNSDILARCAACSASFNQAGLMVLEEQEKKTTFHATCENCGTSSIIFLSVSQGGVVGVGMATDLNDHEASRMFGREAVSADEVIDMHQLITKHKGSLSELLKEIN